MLLLAPSVVTIAVRLPAAGAMENRTVSEFAVAPVTTPAPLLKVMVLFPGAGSKPKPLMIIVVEFAARLAVLLVTTGATVATCTGVPLLLPLVVTTAVRLPRAEGLVPNVTVSDVAVAAVTVPVAPSLKVTRLLPAVVLKPEPLIVTVLALMPRFVVLLVTAGTTVATCTGLLLS